MKTCYVTTPFGKRVNPNTGNMVDYDSVYRDVVQPAALQAGCDVMRADEDSSGGIVQKSILRAAISSDVFIADVGAGNANVMYEVGVRHATQRGLTILIAEAGSRIPFNISYSRVLMYAVDEAGSVREGDAERLRQLISNVITQGVWEASNDSPIFEFFPGYRVELSPELLKPDTRPRTYPPGLRENLANVPASRQGKKVAIQEAEQIVKTSQEVDPAAMVDVLKRYRDISAWDDLIRFVDDMPPEVQQTPQVQQLLALALNRRGATGDRERAIEAMEELVRKTAGDGETHGILGRIYKDRFDQTNDPADMERAIAHYRTGFEKDPSDYYPGLNLVNLLSIYGGDSGKQELERLLPQVRAALAARMDPSRSDYWELATALHLSAMARQWDEAQQYTERIVRLAPERWMLETTIAELHRLFSIMTPPDSNQLQSQIEILRDLEAQHA